MKISETVEALDQLKREYGDVEVLVEHNIYGILPAAVNITLERGTYEVIIDP